MKFSKILAGFFVLSLTSMVSNLSVADISKGYSPQIQTVKTNFTVAESAGKNLNEFVSSVWNRHRGRYIEENVGYMSDRLEQFFEPKEHFRGPLANFNVGYLLTSYFGLALPIIFK